MEERNYDVLIVGGGVAGATMAAYLGNHGIKTAVIEKSLAEQDRIVGELLQPGGVQQLRQMGLMHLLEGFDAQPVEGYALFLDGNNFKVAYPKKGSTTLTGRGFRNGKFVQKIREYILQLPSVTVIEGTVNELLESNDTIMGVRYTAKADKEVYELRAPITVVCDGAYSLFRTQLSSSERKVSGHFLGLVLKNANLPYTNHGHVIIANPAPVLLYPISSTETRVLIDFPGEEAPRKSEELIAYLNDVVGPQIPDAIKPSYFAAVSEGKFKVMPNHYMPAKPLAKQGAALVGDALNMRHPLTGGGMTVAFTDLHLLADKLIALEDFSDSDAVTEAVKQYYEERTDYNATINILADALYRVMRSPDLKQACYDYLKQGGDHADGPISILSAVSRDSNVLLKHFFSVAMFGAKNIIGYYPTITKTTRSYKMMKDAAQIISPLVINENLGIMTSSAFKAAGVVFK